MLHGDAVGLLLGAVVLGAVHGIEPGHGWPVAASYALDQSNRWLYGFAASFILGVGHLVSSIAMVGVFFYAKSYFSLTQVNEPLTILGGVEIGGPVSLVAGLLLIGLGVREYHHGHSHSHGHDDSDAHQHGSHDDGSMDHDGHDHDDHDHDHDHNGHGDHEDHNGHGDHEDHNDHSSHDHDHGDHGHDHHQSGTHRDQGFGSRLKATLPFVGGHSHDHEAPDELADRGLFGIAWFAFVLGFAHEEEFEIIALCAGSNYCLELMSAYAITVIVGIVAVTLLLIAGYQHHEEVVARYTPYLPAFSAAVLTIMGIGFITGLF